MCLRALKRPALLFDMSENRGIINAGLKEIGDPERKNKMDIEDWQLILGLEALHGIWC